MATKTLVYGETRIQLDNTESMTDQQLKNTMASIFPELSNATVNRGDSEITFSLQAGTKGAGGVIQYGETRIQMDNLDGMTDEQIKSTMSSIYPELSNATVNRQNGVVTFSLTAGTKGAAGVIKYGETRIQVDNVDGMSDEQIKSTMSSIYPELSNATVQRNGNEVSFSLQAGTKGAGGVIQYGETRIQMDNLDGMTDEQIKSTMSSIYPELSNATVHRQNGVVTFSLTAGTKGAAGVIQYGETRIQMDNLDGMTDEQIKSTMSSIYPELSNATVNRQNGVVTFSLTAGTKGDRA